MYHATRAAGQLGEACRGGRSDPGPGFSARGRSQSFLALYIFKYMVYYHVFARASLAPRSASRSQKSAKRDGIL